MLGNFPCALGSLDSDAGGNRAGGAGHQLFSPGRNISWDGDPQLAWSSRIDIIQEEIWGTHYRSRMRIIAKSALREFWERFPDAREPLLAWYRETEKADWSSPRSVKEQYVKASIVGDNRVDFNIRGNDYRLVVKINYKYRVVYVRFVGTHADYDEVNVEQA